MKKLLLILLIFTFFIRLIRLSHPQSYIFDEVYHVPTVRGYAQGNSDAYNPFAKAPEPNTAYDWLHPPLAKLIQAGSVKIFGDHSFAWRFPSAVFGTLSVLALYYLSLTLFKKPLLALTAAALFSFDGLQLTMSRITMNDIFVTTWLLLSLTFFYRYLQGDSLKVKKGYLYLTGLFTGLSLATKWSALTIYLVFFFCLLPRFITLFKLKREKLKKISVFILSHSFYLLLIPVSIYFLSYLQHFIVGRTLEDFYHLHQQIYWYQTNLSATHTYQSNAWQWLFLIRPVWFHVDYLKNKIGHIYNLGNPLIFWGGFLSLIYTLFAYFQKKLQKNICFVLLAFFCFWTPWIFSPRIMFFHHFLPALPLLCLITADFLFSIYPKSAKKTRALVSPYLIFAFILFLFFYPLNTAIPIPSKILKLWFWLPSWK